LTLPIKSLASPIRAIAIASRVASFSSRREDKPNGAAAMSGWEGTAEWVKGKAQRSAPFGEIVRDG
jgi:hypothetical protein